jgi:nucleolar complex protein 2
MAKSKATKKFEKRHLKDTLKHRKDVKTKQKLFTGKKRRTDKDYGQVKDNNETADAADGVGDKFEDMTVDDFFQGGFEIPEVPRKKRKRGGVAQKDLVNKKAKVEAGDEDEEQEDLDDSEGGSEEDDYAAGGTIEGVEDNSELDSGDDEETHKKDLDQLAEKDPEFFKYLQENDAELLDFEEGDFAEIDQLSDDEKPQKKKAGKEETHAAIDTSGNLTLTAVKKWENSMLQFKSLRATREVVLAFRAAAHMNDATKKDYKYTITNSDGKASCHNV